MADPHTPPGQPQVPPVDPASLGPDGRPVGTPPVADPAAPTGPGAAATAVGAANAAANVAATGGMLAGAARWVKRNTVDRVFGGDAAVEDPAASTTAAPPPPAAAASPEPAPDVDRARGMADAVRSRFNTVTSALGNGRESFGQMTNGTKVAALGGAGLAAEGGVNTVRNIKNKQYGKAVFSAARCAMGAVVTVAAFKAQGQNQGIGDFTRAYLNSKRSGPSPTPSL